MDKTTKEKQVHRKGVSFP